MHTPVMDGLAARGTRFRSVYTTCPICVPARASFATGRYVHEIGYWDNAMGYDGRIRGWGHELQDSGIPVESIGKLHYRNDQDPTGFDRQHNPMHIWNGIGQVWGSNRRPLEKAMQQGTLTLETDGRPRKLFKKIGPGESGYNRYDKSIADLTVEWLERRAALGSGRTSPWVLYVGFVAPHLPLVVPQEFYDLYPTERLPMPKLRPRDDHSLHPWHFAQVFKDREFESDDQRRIAIAAYLGLCSYLDFQGSGRLGEMRLFRQHPGSLYQRSWRKFRCPRAVGENVYVPGIDGGPPDSGRSGRSGGPPRGYAGGLYRLSADHI